MALAHKRPHDGPIAAMARSKRSKVDQDFVVFSKEDAMAIHRVCKIIEQRADLQRAPAQQFEMPVSYPSHSENHYPTEGWNTNQGLQNQNWNTTSPLTLSSFISTPSRMNYDSQSSAAIGPSSHSMSDETLANVSPDAYNDYHFENLPDLDSLDVALMTSLDNDNLSRQSSHYSEDCPNCSQIDSDQNDPRRQHQEAFTAEEREDAGNPQELIACIRCRQQRVKCNINYDNPHGPCKTCTKAINPKMYKLPCLRYKVGDTVLFREGNSPSLAWSRRWNNMRMANVVDWQSFDTKFIEVSHGFCRDPIRLEVRKFHPEASDVLERKWFHGKIRKTKIVEPYAIEDMTKAAQEVRRYIFENVHPCLITFLEDHDRLVRETYLLAYSQSFRPCEEESLLLHNVLRLWFAIRHTTASEYLCGVETLGMTPEQNDRSYPLFGKIPIAPVMSAQLELILTLTILRPLRKKVLDQLQTMIKANNRKNWFTIYLSCFILLHSCSLATAWHYKYSRRNGVKSRYAMPEYIQELHQGANILLAHFHYCNKGYYPFSSKRNFPASVAEVNEDQIHFIVRTTEYFEARKEMSRKAKEYGHFEEEMYFVSQLFEEDWQPGPSV